MSQASVLRHLKHLVAIYPCTNDQPAVKEALTYCQAVLHKSGAFSDTTLHHTKGFYSLTASTKGKKQPKLLLQAHIDVVPCVPNLTVKLDDSGHYITGRGVYDMLFAIACYLTFIEEHCAELSRLDIGLMLTGDEEIGGFQGVEYLLDQGYGCAVCFLPDAGEGFGDLSIAAKGVYNFDIVINGQSHHGSRPWEGDGATNKLIYLLYELLETFDTSDPFNSTMTVTRLEGGDCDNRGPESALAHLDIRYRDEADFDRIKKLVKQLCDTYNAEPRNMLLADNLTLDIEHPRLKEFLKLYEKHAARPITLSKAPGSSDARFFAKRDIPVILLRPDGSGAHSDEERLSVSSLEQFYLLLEEYILQATESC